MPARSKASSVTAKASWPKSSVWLLASETVSIPAACSTATFFASDRKWKALLGRDAGSHESARTHSRLQNLQATFRKTVKVSPHGYSGGSRWSTSLTMRPSITSPAKRYFFRPLLIVPRPAKLVGDLFQLPDISAVFDREHRHLQLD